ncbi:MAG: hypothetical protein E6I31_08810 [Chloroflexi bacterium]|nr:MAG: hypothetical protein E6I31_08810 [Chloroflexota bacterium]
MKTLAKLLYVEADEEITDLVDRLRDLSLEDEVTFVVPDRARALQSPMSFRLLKRYADSYGKRVNLVSGDPRLQAMSLEAGVTAPRQASVVSAPPKKAPAPPKSPRPGPSFNSYRPYLIGAGALAILALLVGILYLPSATATLSVSGTAIKADVTLLGAPGTAAGSPDHFVTQAVTASESQSLPGTATGSKSIPAQPSVGEVTFTENCVFLCDSGTTTIPTGTSVSTTDGKRYTTTKAGTVASPRGSATVPVKAVTAGPDGNTGAHTITTIDRNRDFNLTVDNAQATSGGADPRTATVIQQSDIDGPRDVYAKDAVPRITDQLKTKAQGQTLVMVGNGVQATAKPDHNVGEEVSGFNIAIKVEGNGVAFDEKTVKQMLKSGLQHKLQSGAQLTSDVKLTYDAIDATTDGHVTLNGHASGFSIPVFLESNIRGHLKGMSPSKAHAFLQSLPNVVDARVTQSPFGLPWLPLFSSRISLKIQEVSGSPSS